jgi:hypothetical protein
MSTDAHDAQDYTANGPTDAGFRTGGDRIKNGVIATGTEIGVHGIGAGTVDGTVESSKPTTGVVGESKRGNGVKGFSRDFAGVVGESETSNGVQGNGPTGVYGEGNLTVRSIGVEGKSGSGIGVQGKSGSGIGVQGSSKKGVGGHFESEEGRGGVFRTGELELPLERQRGRVAQIRLVPLQQDTPFPKLPSLGKVGDLILIRNTALDERNHVIDKTTLWLCIPIEPSKEDSNQWQQIQLVPGPPTTGTL